MQDHPAIRLIEELKAVSGPRYRGTAALARELGFTKQRLYNWFKGHTFPSYEAAVVIEAYLKKQRAGRRGQ